jgi:5-methylcytosine-specific restriction endonuclease McrA
LEQMDLSVPCYYCKKRLFPEDKWVLDHMTPLSQLSSRKEMQSKENLCIACVSCNVKKGSTPLKEFLKQIKKNG